jgi:hypothetical protein
MSLFLKCILFQILFHKLLKNIINDFKVVFLCLVFFCGWGIFVVGVFSWLGIFVVGHFCGWAFLWLGYF